MSIVKEEHILELEIFMVGFKSSNKSRDGKRNRKSRKNKL